MKQAQLLTIVAYGLIAWWYISPWLKRMPFTSALTILLWVHVFRYCVLYLYVAQHEGYPISDVAVAQLVIGDFAGAGLALATIVVLRFRWRLGLVMSWLVVLESILDFLAGILVRSTEPPRADATGVWWLVFVYFAPMILVSLPLMVWQLSVRRNEPLSEENGALAGPGHDVVEASRNEVTVPAGTRPF